MSAARGIALSALVLAVLLAGYLLLFRSSGGHEYTLVFQTAGQLVKDDDVQVGGRRVGSVREIELTDDNQAAVKITVQEPYAPLRDGTQAVIRLTSLSGIANRYVALTPGPGDAEELPDGATLTVDSTTDVVEFAVSLQGRIDDLHRAVDEVASGLTRVDRRIDGSVTNMSVVRYDAYEDAGGQQSASFAFLDSNRTGTVVTAIQGRDYARVYVKELERGKASLALSPEEAEAVERAMAR